MLFGAILQATPGADIENTQYRKYSNGSVQAVMSGSTYDGLRIKPVGTSTRNAALALAMASQKFAEDLTSAQQSLGFEFSKIIDENILDLLA